MPRAQRYSEQWMKFEGNEVDLAITRTPNSQVRDGTDVTFSERALDDLVSNMTEFVGTRVMRYWTETGIAPQNMTVTVKVVLSA